MQQARVFLPVDEQAIFSENSTVTFDLPRQLDIESYTLRVNATINITTAFTAVRPGVSIFNFLRRVELIANGSTVLENLNGFALAYIMAASRSFSPRQAGYEQQLPATAVGSTSFTFAIPLDRLMPDMLRPKDTNLATRDLSTLQLRLTFGAIDDMYTGAGVATFTNGSARVSQVAMQEYPDPRTGKITAPSFLLRRTQQDVSIPSANPSLQVKLPIGNILRRVWLFSVSSGDLSDALLNQLSLSRGSDFRVRAAASEIRSYNAGLWNFSQVGIHAIDFARSGQRIGKVTDCWPLAGAADAFATLDVSAAGTAPTVSIVTEELIPRVPR